jgi:hypothetical protein
MNYHGPLHLSAHFSDKLKLLIWGLWVFPFTTTLPLRALCQWWVNQVLVHPFEMVMFPALFDKLRKYHRLVNIPKGSQEPKLLHLRIGYGELKANKGCSRGEDGFPPWFVLLVWRFFLLHCHSRDWASRAVIFRAQITCLT